MKGVATLCFFSFIFAPSIVHAQSGGSAPQPPASSSRFLSAYRARMGVSQLQDDDPAYSWDARISADIDLFDYGSGRINFFGEYEVVLGSQLRTFDPNQSLYTLDMRATGRVGRNEIAGLFHHTSRHLSDRAKTQAIDWNAIGAEVLRREVVKAIRIESRARGDWTVKRTAVDYTWRAGGRVRLQRPATRRIILIGETSLDVVGTDVAIAGRDSQVGAYVEAGARVPGSAGALDIIVAFERRVDANPPLGGPKSWALLGFRLLGP